VVKGVLIAALIHATYDTAVTYLDPVASLVFGHSFVTQWSGAIFIAFVFVYDGFFLWILYRKLSRYRGTYRELGAGGADGDPFDAELTPAVEYVGDERRER